jgi:hypothetical protein
VTGAVTGHTLTRRMATIHGIDCLLVVLGHGGLRLARAARTAAA